MSESLPPLPRDLDALLDAERGAREPPGVKDRVLLRLEAKLPLDSPQKVPTRQRPRPRSQVWWWLTRASVGGALSAAQLAVALGAGGAVVVGVGALVKHSLGTRSTRQPPALRSKVVEPGALTPGAEEHPPTSPSEPAPPAPSPALPAPVVPAPVEPDRGSATRPGLAHPEPRPAMPARSHPATAPDAPRPERGALAEERALLEEARIALLRGDTANALEALTTHAERFPNSPFAEEREALMVREAVRAGSYKEARAWYDRFRAHYPNSPMLPILESSIRDLSHEEKN